VQGRFKGDACMTLGMSQIHMNKLYLSLGKHCRPLMRITWFPVLDLEMVN